MLKTGSTAFSTASASGLADQADDVVAARGVDAMSAEAAVVEIGDDRLRPRRVVVGERAVLEERAAAGDRGEGGAHASGSDDEDSHGSAVLPERGSQVPCVPRFRRDTLTSEVRANGGRL